MQYVPLLTPCTPSFRVSRAYEGQTVSGPGVGEESGQLVRLLFFLLEQPARMLKHPIRSHLGFSRTDAALSGDHTVEVCRGRLEKLPRVLDLCGHF